MKNSPNLLTYIKDKYYEKIEEKVTEYLHDNREAKSKTYNFPVTLYLNCLLRIDNNVIYFNLKGIQD